MPTLETLIEERRQKREQLLAAGKDPYPNSTYRTHRIADVHSQWSELSDSDEKIWVAGRILSIREHGDIVFCDVFDGSEQTQVVLQREQLEDGEFDLFIDAVDAGDIIEVNGTADTTETGQESIMATRWRMLAKAVRPIPSQYSGLEDRETRLRKRYLDMLMNEEVRDMIRQRARFWKTIRTFLEERDFLEVQTPILETTPGGADARPFHSHHNALDMEVYLRISVGELWQKKLLVGGFEKVFEIGRVFRNEGMSPEHAQDYMQMEFYWAYADHEDGMDLVTDLYRQIAEAVLGTTAFTARGHEVDLSEQWERFDYVETIQDIIGIDVTQAGKKAITEKLDEYSVSYDADITRPRAVDKLWKYCRKQISGPGFLVNVPKELSPLAKEQTNNSDVVAQFQPIIAGSEVGKGYNELNDPQEQNARFKKQEELRTAGDKEAQRFDADFVTALEHGMPPACGFGVSERLFAFLLDKPIKQTQIFPLVRPKSGE